MKNFMKTTRYAAALATLVILTTALNLTYAAENDLADIKAEVTKRHDEAVKRLQDWIKLPSIAAENLNYPAGAELMAKMAKDAGFQQATVVQTDGKPGVFATLDAGAAKTVGLYFMYDVKQFDPKEWTSPPLDAALVDKPGLGKAIVGRGAVNQKGPEAAFLAALHAIKGAGKKMPVNLVMVAEGEEEIGSPHIGQIVHKPEVEAALAKTVGVFMPSAIAGSGWRGDGESRRERRDRMRADFERGEMGPRSGEGHSFVAQGDGGQPGMASGARAEHARFGGRERHHDRKLSEAAAAHGGGESDDRERVEAAG